jgi:arsenical pump membrane protein
MLLRPRRLPEAFWAGAAAVGLVVCGLETPRRALAAVGAGADVYLFLAGMMLLAEVAREQGVFTWIAGRALRVAGGSRLRLFGLVYGVGVVVTALFSNDATVVVLTPAVAAALRGAGVGPLPYLYACAFIANAASFLLPISNPANLVVFGERLPALGAWLSAFSISSLASIAATVAVHAWTARRELAGQFEVKAPVPALSPAGKIAVAALAASASALVASAAFGLRIGAATAACGIGAALAVSVRDRVALRTTFAGVSWSTLVLVAALFVIVQALDASGGLQAGRALFAAAEGRAAATLPVAAVVVIACNLANNLPVALAAGLAAHAPEIPARLLHATLVAIDLGPNLAPTGSLATILWLIALRREGFQVSARDFVRLGVIVLPPALLLGVLTAR